MARREREESAVGREIGEAELASSHRGRSGKQHEYATQSLAGARVDSEVC